MLLKDYFLPDEIGYMEGRGPVLDRAFTEYRQKACLLLNQDGNTKWGVLLDSNAMSSDCYTQDQANRIKDIVKKLTAIDIDNRSAADMLAMELEGAILQPHLKPESRSETSPIGVYFRLVMLYGVTVAAFVAPSKAGAKKLLGTCLGAALFIGGARLASYEDKVGFIRDRRETPREVLYVKSCAELEKEAKVKAEEEAKVKAEEEAKVKAEEEAKLKAEVEAKAPVSPKTPAISDLWTKVEKAGDKEADSTVAEQQGEGHERSCCVM